ncbi:MAG TPA: iron-sulfur cluster assembly scaffold protein [Verrucomicrobiae bacterium]
MEKDLQTKIAEAIANPKNMGEMDSADAIGTVGSPNCGDMVRMWIKFKEENGKKVIDRATFQTFGCETAIAVASLATELIKGKTPEEAMALRGEDLAADLGPLPPMRIHCGQLVEGALRNALSDAPPQASEPVSKPATGGGSLLANFTPASASQKKIVFLDAGKQ